MRVSSDEADPGYAAWRAAVAAGQRVHAYLDGAEVKQCRMADDDLGQVTRCVLDADGGLQIDPSKTDEIWLETVAGKVEIRFEG